MKSIGAFAAKTHFSQLLSRVEKGEKIVITKHGEKIAMLVPIGNEIQNDIVVEAMEAIRSLRKGLRLGKDLTIKSMREEGRK